MKWKRINLTKMPDGKYKQALDPREGVPEQSFIVALFSDRMARFSGPKG